MYERYAAQLVEQSLSAFRVVVLHGARQVGKTTLARGVADRRGGHFLSFDDADSLAFALEDPKGFVDIYGDRALTVIDEVQRGGDGLLRAIKSSVDADQAPGRFLLTGSTNFLTVPGISESLAGRTDIVELRTLSQGELRGNPRRTSLIDRLFGDTAALRKVRPEPESRQGYLDLICTGGYPSVQNERHKTRARWFDRYVQTVIERDIREFRDIRRASEISRILAYVASVAGSELNIDAICRDLGLGRRLVDDYLNWLEVVFLVARVRPWSRNLTARIIKHPKAFLTDTGLAARALGVDATGLQRAAPKSLGPLVESFVVNELFKQLSWSESEATVFHFRDRAGLEVDFVLETPGGRVAAVEVKATSTPNPSHLRGLERLRDRLDATGMELSNGALLHLGDNVLAGGDRITALPVSALWS